MCLSTFGGAMSVFADEETSSEAAEEETVDYSAEDPIQQLSLYGDQQRIRQKSTASGYRSAARHSMSFM